MIRCGTVQFIISYLKTTAHWCMVTQAHRCKRMLKVVDSPQNAQNVEEFAILWMPFTPPLWALSNCWAQVAQKGNEL